MEKIEVLTDEKFQEIYSSEEFRTQVAFAHQHCDKYHNFKYWGTCSYPLKYIVSEEQKQMALAHHQKCKKEAMERLWNKLVFRGMGATYLPGESSDVGNYRIRTEFKNGNGRHFFVELCGGPRYKASCEHSNDRDLENEYSRMREKLYAKRDTYERGTSGYMNLTKQIKKAHEQPYYNYRKLQGPLSLPYNLQNIMQWINNNFECKFEEIEIDNYTLRTEDFICQSL